MSWLHSFADAAQLVLNALDLMLHRLALLAVYFHARGSGQSPLCPVHDRCHHLQIADQFGARSSRSILAGVPLCLEEQIGSFQNPFADGRRALTPSHVQLPGFARVAMLLGKDRRHSPAVVQALPRHRHQKLQGHLRQNLALAHLLLDCFRQHFHQRQPSRYPAHAAIEPARQLVQTVAETVLQLGQHPAHFQCRLVFG